MSFRARDHGRREMWNAKCAMCGEMTRVPWDPQKEPERRVMCRNCRNVYEP